MIGINVDGSPKCALLPASVAPIDCQGARKYTKFPSTACQGVFYVNLDEIWGVGGAQCLSCPPVTLTTATIEVPCNVAGTAHNTISNCGGSVSQNLTGGRCNNSTDGHTTMCTAKCTATAKVDRDWRCYDGSWIPN